MRLLNTSTREFEEFLGSNIPPYAILSHVWSSEEISYADYIGQKGLPTSYGYEKIAKLCDLARNDSKNRVITSALNRGTRLVLG